MPKSRLSSFPAKEEAQVGVLAELCDCRGRGQTLAEGSVQRGWVWLSEQGDIPGVHAVPHQDLSPDCHLRTPVSSLAAPVKSGSLFQTSVSCTPFFPRPPPQPSFSSFFLGTLHQQVGQDGAQRQSTLLLACVGSRFHSQHYMLDRSIARMREPRDGSTHCVPHTDLVVSWMFSCQDLNIRAR